MGLSFSLQVLRAGQVAQTLLFDSETHRTIKIGRVSTAQVQLDDSKVARIHAVIECSGADISLIDMGSIVGTLVNGVKISRTKLQHNDQILLGDTTLVVQYADSPAAAVAKPRAVISSMPEPMAVKAKTPAVLFAPSEQLQFDPGGLSDNPPMRRITQEQLRHATSKEAAAQAGLIPEDPLTADNRVLELRFYWGETLLGMHHYVRPKKVTIGETTHADIFLSSEGLPVKEFPLIRFDDNDYILTYTGQMDGEIETGGQINNLNQMIELGHAQPDAHLTGSFQFHMPPDARALLHWGGATFAMRFVPPGKWIPAPFGHYLDLAYLNVMILSFFLHVAVVITLALYPRDTDALKVDLFGQPDRFASLLLEPPKDNKSTRDILDKIKKQVEAKQEEIKKAPDKDKPHVADLKNLNVKTPVPVKKTVEEKKAEVAARFKNLLGDSSGAAGNLLGGGGAGSLSGTLQNVIGTAGAGSASASLQGLGVRGTGPLTGGGIGTSRGIAGIGTSGRLGTGGLGYGAGVGLGKTKEHNMVGLDTPVVEGSLSADIIKKVVRENQNQVRYCYEVELQHNQNLEGRVLVKWIIGGTGSVIMATVKDSSLKNANVENCLLAKIRNWKFPPPAGGGTVEVNYPFVFKAS